MFKFKTKPDYSKQYADKRNKDLDKVSTYRAIKSFSSRDGAILDIGCGTGYLLEYLGSGTGADIDPNLIEECRKNYPDSLFLVSDCYSIPLESNTFDTIVMCMIVEHLTEPRKALLEAKRLLRPGGNLIIVVPRKDDWFYNFLVKKDPTHVREYTVKELVEVASDYFSVANIALGTVSTKIPSWMTDFIRSDIILNCKK